MRFIRLCTRYATCFFQSFGNLLSSVQLSVSIIVASLSVLVGFFSRRGRNAGTHTTSNERSGNGTHGTGIELSVNSRPINVDITTSTWVDSDNGAKQLPDTHEDNLDYKSKDHLHAV